MDLGKSLKIALAKNNLKNKDLAEYLNVKPTQISNWISRGNMSHQNLLKICSYLEMRVSEFVALSEE